MILCQLFEAQRQINLIADIEDAANIQNCGESNEINHENETFEEDKIDEHEVIHEHEHMQHNNLLCDSDPCENGGTCSVRNNTAVCSCSIGFAGKHCEEC